MTKREIVWPRLARIDGKISTVLYVLAAIGGTVFLENMLWGALIAFLSAGGFGIIRLRDEIRRLLWARKFDRVTTFRRLKPTLQVQPNRYLLHFVTYSGADRMRLRPAIVVEDRDEDRFYAIYPGSHYVLEQMRALGIQNARKDNHCDQDARSDPPSSIHSP